MIDTKLNDLVKQNYIYASVLYYFGIKFYDYADNTLQEICEAKKIDTSKLIKNLESITQKKGTDHITWASYPVELIIAYLRHMHFVFVKEKLPYIVNLIEEKNEVTPEEFNIVNDLKLIFPIFVDDFIKHIHEEEDTFFSYIKLLSSFLNKGENFSKVFATMKTQSIQQFAIEHHFQDEMRGIREMTNHYQLPQNASLHLEVIYAELANLEKDLQIHSKVEDDILFVKALQLESKVKDKIKQFASLN